MAAILGALGGAGVTAWMLRRRPTPSHEPRSAEMIRAGSIAEALGALAARVCDVHDALLLADEHRHLVDVNDRACALYGYTRAEMLGMTITDLIPPEGLAACESRLKELDQSGFLSRETTHRRKDGTTIPVEVRLRRMEVGGRRFLGSVVRDISDRVRRTELAHLAARQWQETFDATHDGICLLDLNQRIVRCNRALLALFNRTEHSAVGRTCWEVIHGGREPVKDCPVQRAAHTLQRESTELEIQGRWFEVIADPLLDETNTLKGMVHILRDLTDRRRAHEQLLAILDGIQSPLYVSDPTTYELLYANPALTKSMGGVVNGQPCYKALREFDAPCAFCTNDRIFGENLGRTHVWEHRNPFTGRWYQCEDRAIRWVDGRMVRFELATDITEKKLADEEHQRLDQQLQQSQKMESLGVLAGGIAHDFNNILQSVLGNASLALEDLPAEAPVKENLREIERSARRAAELCRQMLAYSGRGTQILAPVHVKDLVMEMVDLLKSSVTKMAEVRLELASDLPPIRADAVQIRQILMNLVVNASESIGERPGIITVSTGQRDCQREELDRTLTGGGLPEGPYVWMEVTDTGCGMDPITLSRIFDPFFSTKFTGRGLGLPTVLGLVRAHKGTLSVASTPGRGTAVRVYLPAVIEGAARRPGPPADASRPAAQVILLVDDEDAVRQTGARMLRRLGYSVVTAADGFEALDLYDRMRGQIALVVLDLTMPRLSGVDTLRELKRKNAAVRVLISSGYTKDDVSTRFAPGDICGFLHKPYSREELQLRLQETLAG